MNKNKEQIKNEAITEDEMIELETITLDAAYELYTIVKDAIMEFEDSDLWPLYKNLRKELF
tara:strand:+ start:12897 stop:13079 length:183 start_codon:yes stop_codon:yes gene_type:complete